MAEATIKLKFVIDGKEKIVDATTDLEEIGKQIGTVKDESEKLRDSLLNANQGFQAYENLSNIVAKISGGITNLTQESRDFDTAMREANTMAGKGADDFAKLKDQVADVANTVPMARDALAKGLYQVISNGVPEDNWISYLQASAKSSIGGLADLQEVVKVTSTIIKNYGLEWEDAMSIQDKIQLTAKNGVTSFEQLAQALPRVTSNASVLGVTIDELMATFSTLTGVSGNTAEVSTQLAAIFTALVKPSSEAAEMAAAMGIQFDAAAIKSAGSMQNFIKSLDAAVKQYAASSGMLEQEIYGKLFGSAESLRALIPLTNQLADKFDENVAAMQNSAGTIDEAFQQMEQTSGASLQALKNKFAWLTDAIAQLASNTQPVLTFSNSIFQAGTNIAQLLSAAKAVKIALAGFGEYFVKAGNKIKTFKIATVQASLAAKGLTVSLRTLFLGSAIITAITSIAAAIYYFTTKTDEATDSVENAANAVDGLKDAQNTFNETQAKAKSEIDSYITRLKILIDTNGDTKDTIEVLNQKYGESFGQYETAEEWYDTLIKKSKEYCDQLAYEATARLYADEIAQKYKQIKDLERKKKEKNKEADNMSNDVMADGLGITAQMAGSIRNEAKEIEEEQQKLNQEIKELQQEQKEVIAEAEKTKAQLKKKTDDKGKKNPKDNAPQHNNNDTKALSIKQLEERITQISAKLKNYSEKDSNKPEAQKLIKELKQLNKQKETLEKKYGLAKDSNKTKNKRTQYEKLGDEEKKQKEIYQKAAKAGNQDAMQKAKAKLDEIRKQREEIKTAYDEAERPLEFNSLDDFKRELQYLNNIKEFAPQADLTDIEQQIKDIENKQQQFTLQAHLELDIDKLDTPKKIQDEIDIVTAKLNIEQNPEQREMLTQRKQQLQEKQNKIEAADNGALAPIEEIKTQEQLDYAIKYTQQLQQTATTEEKELLQERIDKLQELQQKWDDFNEDLQKPADIDALDNIRDIDQAISWHQSKQQRTTNPNDIAISQQQIRQAEKKKEQLQIPVKIENEKFDLQQLQQLDKKELNIKIKETGFDALTNKIKELQKLLDNTQNPLDDKQRAEVINMISVYEQWRKKSVKTFDTFKEGYSAIKGIGDTIKSVTETLEGDADAWQKITAVIDSFIAVYESLNAIIGIIQVITALTKGQTIAQTAEATATTAATTASFTNAAAQETNAAAAVPAVIANKAATASYLELAAAQYMAAHAYIPFAGYGIAAGFAAAAAATTAAIGSIAAFADGGIVSGPTYALIGEYAGASNNPEVVAPLDKLRSLIGSPEGAQPLGINFRIQGRDLVGVMANETRIASKSGKRTNIKI